MLFPLALSSSARNLAAEEPVIPDPTMTISALEGSSGVVLWPRSTFDGSLCQNDLLELGTGSPALSLDVLVDMKEGMAEVMAL